MSVLMVMQQRQIHATKIVQELFLTLLLAVLEFHMHSSQD